MPGGAARARSNAFSAGSVPAVDPVVRLRELAAATQAWLRRRLARDARARLADLVDGGLSTLPGRASVVCHADPWYGNMLVDETGHLSAVLDFEGLCLADPAFDLAAITYLTPPSNDRTIAAYLDRRGPLDDLEARVSAYLLVRELWGLAYALRNDLEEEAEHAFADVRGLVEA